MRMNGKECISSLLPVRPRIRQATENKAIETIVAKGDSMNLTTLEEGAFLYEKNTPATQSKARTIFRGKAKRVI